jgi:hypothetical protein
MLISKKAQSQIITTVLIILLVLVSIIVIWQIVQGTVRRGLDESEIKAACIGVNLEITNVDSTSNLVYITMNIGGAKDIIVSDVEILVNDVVVTATPDPQAISLLETKFWFISSGIDEGDEISAAPVLGGDTEIVCDIADTHIVID